MIKAFNYIPEYEPHRNEYLEAIQGVLDSGWVVLGPEVKKFEAEFAEFIGAKHAVGLNSGTDAIVIALKALDIGKGQEVITVANTAVPTVAAIRMTGATPVFVDIEPDNLLIDVEQVEALINNNTAAIIPVHLHGLPVDLNPLIEIASKHNVPIIEDCAQSFGAEYHSKHTGTIGLISCFSFYPTKNLGAFGDGGLCITDNEELAEKMRMLRMYGFKGDGYAHIEGINSRLDELQAALLRVKLKYFPDSLEQRRSLAAKYTNALQNTGFILPNDYEDRKHAYHLYVIRSEKRSELIEEFKQSKIGFGIHYPIPIHLMDAYSFLNYKAGSLPETEKAANEILSLPFYPGLPDDEFEQVINVLTKFADC